MTWIEALLTDLLCRPLIAKLKARSLRRSSGLCEMAMCEVCNCRQVLSAEMMCFYSAVLLCFGMAINHGLQSTAKRHLLLSASLVVGRDYSQNKVQTGWLIEGSAEVRAAVYFHTRRTLVHFIRMDFYGWSCHCVSLSLHKSGPPLWVSFSANLSVLLQTCCVNVERAHTVIPKGQHMLQTIYVHSRMWAGETWWCLETLAPYTSNMFVQTNMNVNEIQKRLYDALTEQRHCWLMLTIIDNYCAIVIPILTWASLCCQPSSRATVCVWAEGKSVISVG